MLPSYVAVAEKCQQVPKDEKKVAAHRATAPVLSQVLCKPKIMALKSVTLEKIEQMEKNFQQSAAAGAKRPDRPALQLLLSGVNASRVCM